MSKDRFELSEIDAGFPAVEKSRRRSLCPICRRTITSFIPRDILEKFANRFLGDLSRPDGVVSSLHGWARSPSAKRPGGHLGRKER